MDPVVAIAADRFNLQVGPAQTVPRNPLSDSPDSARFKQRVLGSAIDVAKSQALLNDKRNADHFRAHARLLQLSGASAWLFASPSVQLGSAVEPKLLNVMLQRRPRVPVFQAEGHCRCCDGVVDIF